MAGEYVRTRLEGRCSSSTGWTATPPARAPVRQRREAKRDRALRFWRWWRPAQGRRTPSALLRRTPPTGLLRPLHGGKEAVTHYRTIRRGRNTLLEVDIDTGRKNQIRPPERAGLPRGGRTGTRRGRPARWARLCLRPRAGSDRPLHREGDVPLRGPRGFRALVC